MEEGNAKKIIRLFRSPNLDTVNMVEKTIVEYSGELKRTQLWEKLPRKVMWHTFTIILDYLTEINKIVISDNGIITYIWNPKLAGKVKTRKSY